MAETTTRAKGPAEKKLPPKKAATETTPDKDAAVTPADAKAKVEPEAKPEPDKAAENRQPSAVQKIGTPGLARDAIGSSLAEVTTFTTVLLYGPEGTGKTTAALRMARLAKPKQRVILINAEAGAKPQALRQRGIDLRKVEVWPPVIEKDDGTTTIDMDLVSYEGLNDLADQLADRSDQYIGWVWDSGSEITRRLLDKVVAAATAKDARKGKARDQFQINLEDHGVASSMLRDLLRQFRDLPMHGVITALERRDIDQDTGRVRYGPQMSPAMANDTAGLVDIVGWCVVEELGEHNIRSAHFVPTQRRRAKDRYGLLPAKLADPYFDRLVGYVDGEMTRETDPVQGKVRELARSLASGGDDKSDKEQEKQDATTPE